MQARGPVQPICGLCFAREPRCSQLLPKRWPWDSCGCCRVMWVPSSEGMLPARVHPGLRAGHPISSSYEKGAGTQTHTESHTRAHRHMYTHTHRHRHTQPELHTHRHTGRGLPCEHADTTQPSPVPRPAVRPWESSPCETGASAVPLGLVQGLGSRRTSTPGPRQGLGACSRSPSTSAPRVCQQKTKPTNQQSFSCRSELTPGDWFPAPCTRSSCMSTSRQEWP